MSPRWASTRHGSPRNSATAGSPSWSPAIACPPGGDQLNLLRESTAPRAQALTIATGPITAAGDDAQQARDIAASCAAWYLTAMGDVYARSVSSQGCATEVKEIIAANPRPSPRHGIVPAGARGVLGQVAASGTSDQVREQLESWDDVADVVAIVLPPGLPWPVIEATLRAAAPGA